MSRNNRLYPVFLCFAFLFVLCTRVLAQNQEFVIHDNGYIYPEVTMGALRTIVDSLDEKFKTCPPERTLHSLPQTMASVYTVKGGNIKNIFAKLEGAGNGKQVIARVPRAKLRERGILYASNFRGKRAYHLIPLNYGSPTRLFPNEEDVYRIQERIFVEPGYESVLIWVLDESPTDQALPAAYARMIQYVDCLVDTTENIIRESAYREGGEDFAEVLRPAEMEQLKVYFADSTGRADRVAPIFDRVLAHVAAGESVGDLLETYLERRGEYAAALESKRLRRVVGYCSQDYRPRYHAMDIARLSAAAREWPVFLRAHLNIMNDRFSRISDGSYAWAGRGTYLAELEALNIDAPTLLVGSCLQAQNLADGHYQGSWNRVGRALQESAVRAEVIARLQALIRDEQLDDLNRLTGVYLLRYMASNYGSDGPDAEIQRALTEALAGLKEEWATLVEVE